MHAAMRGILRFGFLNLVFLVQAQNSTNYVVTTIAPTTKSALNCSKNQIFQDLKCIDRGLKLSHSSLGQFLAVAAISVLWIIYLTFFNSRILGIILTKLLNALLKDGYMKVGAVTFSVLSGKVMFRDVEFITTDSSVFIYDGYCIFRWWRPYKFSPWRKKKDLNEGHTRLSIFISGLEYHVYNRSSVYGRLEELFGIDSQIFVDKSKPKSPTTDQKIAWWRNLIPVIKIQISYGKVVFGNKLLPSTLVAAYEDITAQYNTAKASNMYDLFMHVLEGSVGSVKVMLISSPKYDPTTLPPHKQTQKQDLPPRKMGEGYDLVNSNHVSFKYIWDEPGRTGVPSAESNFSEYEAKTIDHNGEEDDTAVWELEVRCDRRVALNYGPWADRQINQLWRFYYPLDYQKQQVTEESGEGELRSPTGFHVYISLLQPADIDLLFLKDEEPSAIHINVNKGTCVEMHAPMVITEKGFTTRISGQLMYPNASTSMSYRPLLNAEVLSFTVDANYPLVWNDEQLWTCDIKASKVSTSLIFEHKNFIADLMEDWSSKDAPDLFSFYPYKMKFSFDLQEFELGLPANEYNWIDCATKRKENALVDLTGKALKIDFTLPFNSFLPSTYKIPFSFHIWRAELCLYLPQSNPSRTLLMNLRDGMDVWYSDSGSANFGSTDTPLQSEYSDRTNYHELYKNSHKLRKNPHWGEVNHDWVKCWDAPEIDLAITYTWHPNVHRRENEPRQNDVNKEMEKAEKLMLKSRSSKKIPFKWTASILESMNSVESGSSMPGVDDHQCKAKHGVSFEPTQLDPDEISVEFTLKPGSTLYLYGSLLHHFVAIKENYLGVDDKPVDFVEGQKFENPEPDDTPVNGNEENYRTLQVTVNVNLHNVRGILPTYWNSNFKGCPMVKLKRLTFEMDKNYHQTRLQLLLSKLAINVEDSNALNIAPGPDQNMDRKKGWLMLMDLQLRGHAMFSGAGVSRGAVTIEYGWLTEVLIGPITGSLSVPQIQLLAQWAEKFVFLLKNRLHEMKPTFPNKYLSTGINWEEKKLDGKPIAEGDVKYLMAQVKLDSVKLRVIEKDSALDLSISPILISNGNVQFPGVTEAASIRIQEIIVKQRMKKIVSPTDSPVDCGLWLEAGEVRFGSLHAMITVATPEREMSARQNKFLRFHDNKTRRLHFLWQDGILGTGYDSSPKSVLSSVRKLKSWGCNFCSSLTSKHPTYYYKARSVLSKQSAVFYGHKNPRHVYATDSESSSSSQENDTDDSDVFDPGMEYGMSLLAPGKCLLSRSRALTLSKNSLLDSADETAVRMIDFIRNADPVLRSTILEESQKEEITSPNHSRPSLKRQNKITNSTGQIYKPGRSSMKKSSVLRKLRSTTGATSWSKSTYQQQVSFAPSPEKRSILKKSSSQADIDVLDTETSRRSIKRIRSSDSNLYHSAESEFRSTTSLSSSDFYSAESDFDEEPTDKVDENTEPMQCETQHFPVRPGTLPLETGNTNIPNPASATNVLLTPTVTKSSSMSPGSIGSNERSSSERRDSVTPPFAQYYNPSLFNCFESQLSLVTLNPVPNKDVDYNDEGWFDENLYRLPSFSLVKDGIHPSVMIDKDTKTEKDLHKTESTNRELSFDEMDSSGKATSIAVHLRESLDVQLTPLLLSTITHIIDSATPVLKHEDPMSVLSQLEMHCANEAAERIPDDQDVDDSGAKEQGKKKTDKHEKAKPSLKRQKRMEESVDDETKADMMHGLTVTRPPPGTKLTVKVDRVRINVIQSSLGNDNIFCLGSNKLSPVPCITILATRLDSFNVSIDMNSRRKNRLMIENLRKMSRSHSGPNITEPESDATPFNKKKASVSSDFTSQKHFLVLLNAKAMAKSVAVQMRSLSLNGNVPEKTSITALPEKSCQAPFCFNPAMISPEFKELMEKWRIDNDETNASSSMPRKVNRYIAPGPPQPWGWVMLEAGVDRVRINVVKQVSVKQTSTVKSDVTNESFVNSDVNADTQGCPNAPSEGSAFDESVRVRFVNESLQSLPESAECNQAADDCWAVKDSNLHASQGELFIGSVWINAPSPPTGKHIPGKLLRKWNLLSCMTASITSWLDPADQLATSLSLYNDEKLTRQCSVIACVLTEALDRLTSGKDGPEKPIKLMKMKYDVLTQKAKLLRKDPNFLLSHELQCIISSPEGKQMLMSAIGQFGGPEKQVPALSTLKKGVFAIIRQVASNYSGIINSSQLKVMDKIAKKNELPYNEYDVNEKDIIKEDQDKPKTPTSLVVNVEPPRLPSDTESHLTETDAVPIRMPRPAIKRESMPVVMEEQTASLSDAEKGQAMVLEPLSSSARDNASPITSAEKLVQEQQKSMYSWMTNAAKPSSPTKSLAQSNFTDTESQPLIDNENGYEETDFIRRISPYMSRKQSKQKKENTMVVINSEEVFEIFLRNVGLEVDSPLPVQTVRNKSFIGGQCLGSLSVNVKLNKLQIDKKDADPLYNIDGQWRKKKSMRGRKPASYSTALDHGRDPRSLWAKLHPGHSVLPSKPPPILMCQQIEIKSSVIESDVEQNERRDAKNSIAFTPRNRYIKDKKTLYGSAMLSVDHIMQHVDVALLRLVHQVTQISDNVQQAKTNILVNKYTGGSVSPDFKAKHRRMVSVLSEASNISTSRINRQNSQLNQVPPPDLGQPSIQEYHNDTQGDGNDDNVYTTDDDDDSVSSASTEVPHCWQVMYKMVDLYETVQDNKAQEQTRDYVHVENEGDYVANDMGSVSTIRRRNTLALPQHDPFLVLAVKVTAVVKQVSMHAAVGDLKLNTELSDLMTRIDHSKDVVNAYAYKMAASSTFLTNLKGVSITLIDQASKQRRNTIATVSIKQSSLNASTNHCRESEENVAEFHLGQINFDLSQHPASLHDVVSRGSRQLSAHISEFTMTPTMKSSDQFDHVDSAPPFTPVTPALSTVSSMNAPMTPVTPSALTTLIDLSSQDSSSGATSSPVQAQFKVVFDGIAIVASLLPSLHASYRTGEVKGEGHTGMDATFQLSLPQHVLEFTALDSEEPSSTAINLPKIEIEGEYRQGEKDTVTASMERLKAMGSQRHAVNTDLLLRSGDYLLISFNIGSFEHTLTTDLLNQLIFLQEVLLKEVNQMIDKVSKTKQPVPLFSESNTRPESQSQSAPLLYEFKLQLKGIQITAATPSLKAARLKTGEMMFELSNRVMQNMGSKSRRKKKGIDVPKYLKLFGKAQVDLTLSLGTLVHDPVYPEADPEFRELAYFTTRIGLQNTTEGNKDPTLPAHATDSKLPPKPAAQSLHDRAARNVKKGEESENSIVLISLMRPLFFVQPTAFDNAILVYWSYKNAYEDWKEHRKNVVQAAKQVRDAFQSTRSRATLSSSLSRTSTNRKGTVFLELSVNDMGICLPVTHRLQIPQAKDQEELPSAMVLTISRSLISASYSQSLVTKGQMKGFCLRFADDFQTSLDDWKYDPCNADTLLPGNAVMNAIVVPEGTYEICSDTNTFNTQSGVPAIAKTSVNVDLQMKGMDVHFDTKIGSYFSRLSDTLLAITVGQVEPAYDAELDINLSPSEVDGISKSDDVVDGIPRPTNRTFSYSSNSSSSAQPITIEVQMERNRKIEHEIIEQAKVIKDLRQLGAKPSYVEEEERRMHELETALSQNFRKVVRSRLRRSSIKGSKMDIKSKFKPSHQRAKSATVFNSGRELSAQSSQSGYSTLPRHPIEGWHSYAAQDSRSAESMGYQATSDQLFHHTDGTPSNVMNQNFRESYYSSDTESDASAADDEVEGLDFSFGGQNRAGKAAMDSSHAAKVVTSKSENSLANSSQTASSPLEADIQLELEVKAVVDGGKIECHPHLQEIDTTTKQDYGMMPPMYPASKVRSFVKNATVFYIPGLEVAVQYNSASSANAINVLSKHEEKVFCFPPGPMAPLQEQNEGLPESASFITPSGTTDNPVIPQIEVTTPSQFMSQKSDSFGSCKATELAMQPKRGCVRAKLNLQSLPEMVISPYLLDFLEQTLNEISDVGTLQHSLSQKYSGNSSRQGSFHESSGFSEEETSDIEVNIQTEPTPPRDGSMLSSESTLNSLPLDVVVEINVQPSQVRFNCVPMSRVECLLQIPNIDLKFSSIAEDIAQLPFSTDETSKKEHHASTSSDQFDISEMNADDLPDGLHFSAVLSDFSIYVFHPYGGKQSTTGAFPWDMNSSFTASPGMSDSPFAKSGSGRRDSLSVNLEFVKITLIRRRKGDTILVADMMSPGNTKSKVDNVVLHVSGLLDIGKASFKYDMRRLNEILAFPKAWYRRSIARRLFLGDTSDQSTLNSPFVKKKAKQQTTIAKEQLPTPVDSTILSFLTADSPLSPSHRPLTVKASNKSNYHRVDDEPDYLDGISIGTNSANNWQALVLLKMNMSRLDVEMNMSNVMGTTVWSCNALSSTGKLMFHSNGDRDITLACNLDNSQINARGGIIGGQIELDKFQADCRLFDPAEGEPLHKLGMQARSLDGKIEYMGGCAMMGQLTQVDFQLKDEWRDPVQSLPSNIDKGTVYVVCDLGWRVFQLSISRSTTPDVIKMLTKLEEFFTQQLNSSVRAISSITQSHSRPGSPKQARDIHTKATSPQSAIQYDHRRHWPPVFKAISEALGKSDFDDRSGMQLRNKSLLLGGSAYLHGDGLIVVCFHGTNFKSKSWALFNILQPNIEFSTEVQEIKESIRGHETSTLAIQSLTVTLGHDKWLSRTQKSTDPLATVSRVARSRNQNPPPGSAPIAEWFAFMTASRNEELRMLRTLNKISASGGKSSRTKESSSQQQGSQAESSSGIVYSHEAEIIFALPKVQLDFKTEHIQGPNVPNPNDAENKPVVESTFITEFTDNICVTMDVELLLFLHDLISSYLKEKQQALSSRTKLSSISLPMYNEKSSSSSSETSLVKPLPVDPLDLREFVCKNWQLEPTVSLISWAGRRIEPVGVDYILQKLGFQHARTTIPKWLQRGVLDVLDKGIAISVKKLIVAIIYEQSKK